MLPTLLAYGSASPSVWPFVGIFVAIVVMIHVYGKEFDREQRIERRRQQYLREQEAKRLSTKDPS